MKSILILALTFLGTVSHASDKKVSEKVSRNPDSTFSNSKDECGGFNTSSNEYWNCKYTDIGDVKESSKNQSQEKK